MYKGGTQHIDGLSITMVHADHSSSFIEGRYVREPVGFVVALERLYLYRAGDTDVFGDASGRLRVRSTECKRVIPIHYGTTPRLTGTVDAFGRELALRGQGHIEIELRPGEVLGKKVCHTSGIGSATYLVLIAVSAMVVVVALAELLHWLASRSARVKHGTRRGSYAIVVLGYRSRDHKRLHPVQRWRTEIGARSLASVDNGFLVFTGGASGGGVSEAEIMAAYAATLQVAAERIGLETRARSTWDNMRFTLPMVDRYDSIAIASDPMHAARARRYALKQRPDLTGRIVLADNYRFLEQWWLKVPTAAYEVYIGARNRLS